MIETPLLGARHIRHGFFTREGGHSTGHFASLNCGMGSGDDKETVRRNRTIVAEALGVAEPRLLTAHQHHSADAITVIEPWPADRRPMADAMVSNAPGLALGVLTADCAPILFADQEARVIGAAHAGWKGALAGVTGATLAAMEALGARRARIVVAIGPAISQAAYEVGPEFPERYLENDARNARFFTPSRRPHHSLFDLPAYLAARLQAEGAGEVVNLAICTFSDEQHFFSYRRTTHRRERDYGRQISAIAIQ
ncbi:MAG: peptidoglycan editing factor PgeF [Hyphomicrobiales bacterium]